MFDQVVFVGGAVVELYAPNTLVSEHRPTDDIDCTLELTTTSAFYVLDESLRKKGFLNDTDGPICRYRYQGIKVDVMPTGFSPLGMNMRWFTQGIKSAQFVTLQTGTRIRIFALPYFLAIKLEALQERGNVLYDSKDMEDIVYLLSEVNDFENLVSSADFETSYFLAQTCRYLLKHPMIHNAVEGLLPRPLQPFKLKQVFDRLDFLANRPQ